ncbi:hypothetical protein ABT314_19030, partial [Streptomyces spiralis]
MRGGQVSAEGRVPGRPPFSHVPAFWREFAYAAGHSQPLTQVRDHCILPPFGWRLPSSGIDIVVNTSECPHGHCTRSRIGQGASAETYELLHPASAREPGERKTKTVPATRAVVILTADTGCRAQVAAIPARIGEGMPYRNCSSERCTA